MREIKFRGKRVDNGEWAYGDYFRYKPSKNWDVIHNIAPLDTIKSYEVYPDTVGQYTGLRDISGAEIYEGDIVRCWGGECFHGYWECDKNVVVKDMARDCFELGESEYLEVIGNIYENQQLLTEGGQSNEA